VPLHWQQITYQTVSTSQRNLFPKHSPTNSFDLPLYLHYAQTLIKTKDKEQTGSNQLVLINVFYALPQYLFCFLAYFLPFHLSLNMLGTKKDGGASFRLFSARYNYIEAEVGDSADAC
jgi:hypothetical protein